jgi:phosphatidylglycerol:prolipoprotein diacylglycerol transferase
MIPILFKLGPITIYSYAMMMALGFLAADFVINSEYRRQGLNRDFASSLVLWAAIGAIACSRLYAVIDDFPRYMRDPWSIIFSSSGFVWYGALIGGLLSAYFVSRYYKINFLTTGDMAAPAQVIGQALGRIGCHLSGDGDWGMPTRLPWGVQYLNAIVMERQHRSQTRQPKSSGFRLPSRRPYALDASLRGHPLHDHLFVSVVAAKGNQSARAVVLPLSNSGRCRALHRRVPARESSRLHGAQRGPVDRDCDDDNLRYLYVAPQRDAIGYR